MSNCPDAKGSNVPHSKRKENNYVFTLGFFSSVFFFLFLFCLSECAESDLQRTFLEFPGSYIQDTVTESVSSLSLDLCLEQCRSMTSCRTLVYDHSNSVCHVHMMNIMELAWGALMSDNFNFSLYQKMCAWDGRRLCLLLLIHTQTTHRSARALSRMTWTFKTVDLQNFTHSATFHVLVLKQVPQTPSTSLRHPSFNHCSIQLRHRSQKTVTKEQFLLLVVLKQ